MQTNAPLRSIKTAAALYVFTEYQNKCKDVLSVSIFYQNHSKMQPSFTNLWFIL